MVLINKIGLLSILVFSILVIFFVTINRGSEEMRYKIASLGEQKLKLELAMTPVEQYTGLSNREELCAECGMLFIFPEKEEEIFVMRQMNFSLDIIWLADEKVIGFSENLEPEEEPYTQYRPPGPVDKVIEIAAGFVDKKHIKLGDKLIYAEK